MVELEFQHLVRNNNSGSDWATYSHDERIRQLVKNRLADKVGLDNVRGGEHHRREDLLRYGARRRLLAAQLPWVISL